MGLLSEGEGLASPRAGRAGKGKRGNGGILNAGAGQVGQCDLQGIAAARRQPCKDLVARHRKAARWVAFFVGLSIFFTILGMVTDPVTSIGMCKVYP